MLEPYFKKEDFILCDVPVPEGYPQSQTHAGIAIYNGKFYLTCSPYPLKKYSRLQIYAKLLLQKLTFGKLGQFVDADSYENPLLYEGIDNGGKPPFKFRLLHPAPLMESPKRIEGVQSYNSDPDIFVEDDTFYILNRSYYRSKDASKHTNQKALISLIEGGIRSGVFSINYIEELTKTDKSFLSPCVTHYNSQYIYAHLESNSAIDGKTFEGIYLSKGKSIDDFKTNTYFEKTEIDTNDLLPWHMSLFTHKDTLYAIITCAQKNCKIITMQQYLGRFDKDLTMLHIYRKPLVGLNSYRGAACILSDEMFVLYTTTVHENIKGSKSVDGRNILLAYTSFPELLEVLQDED